MARQYQEVCREYNCKTKIFTQMTSNLGKQIGNPDVIVLFTSTVSHKMVKCAVEEGRRCNAHIFRSHTSSKNALKDILDQAVTA